MKRFPLYLYIIGVLMAVVSSCDDYDSWTADPQAQLTFGRDTVSFDTLISTVSSSTQRLLVYNNNESGVRISDVRLKHAGKSHFRVNVDGQFVMQSTESHNGKLTAGTMYIGGDGWGIKMRKPLRLREAISGFCVVPPGIEPGTQGFSVLCSTN